MLPANIMPGVNDPFPPGVFLIPLCTTRAAAIKMTRAIYTAYLQAQDIEIMKDFLNALQYVSDPENSPCWEGVPPSPIVVTIEHDGDCQRLIVDGVPVTDWICPAEPGIISEPTGTLGLTIAEMEMIIMGCLDISGSIRMGANGMLEVKGCEGWETIAGQTAPLQTSASAAIAQGMAYSAWVAANKPELPSLASIPHENPQYNTSTSVQCAKATSLVETLKGFLQTTRDTMQGIDEGLGFQETVALVSAGLAVANLPGALFVASQIWGAKLVAGEYVDEIDNDLLNTELWSDIICETVELMNTGTRVETDDIDHIITNWQERDTVPEALKQILYSYPVLSWKENTQEFVASADCGCSQYLPFGSTPPLLAGQVSYSFEAFGFASAGVPMPDDNDPYEEIFVGGERGVMFGGDPTTEFVSESGGNYESFLQAVYLFTDVVSLSGIKILFAFPDGTPSVVINWSNKFFTTESGGTWKYGAGWGNYNDSPEVRSLSAQFTAFSIGAQAIHAGAARRASVVQVLVSGSYLGEVFTDLPPDTVFDTNA